MCIDFELTHIKAQLVHPMEPDVMHMEATNQRETWAEQLHNTIRGQC